VLFAAPIRKDLPELWKNGVRIAFARVRRNHPNSLNPAFKVTNCLNGILAKMETLEKGAFEGIFLNLDGRVAEGTISNLFIIKNGVVKTPHLSCGILDGVTRSAVIEVAKDAKIPVRETHLDTKEVLSADEVFLTSTTMEVMPVVRVEKSKIGDGKPGNLSQILHAKFRDLLKKELRLP
ncbi:MAG: aminotransferase class IV, partial [Elusimicrobia bacterium]|nr:aminotransferase class IV [Elusimicrobiota bacterium]